MRNDQNTQMDIMDTAPHPLLPPDGSRPNSPLIDRPILSRPNALHPFPQFESRVNALDAERLHEELLYLLESQVSSCWSLLFPESIPKQELTLFLRLLIYFASTYRLQPTPSDAMFNVKLSNPSPSQPIQTQSPLSEKVSGPVVLSSLALQKSHQDLNLKQRVGYLVLVILGPWALSRLRMSAETSYRDFHARQQQKRMRRTFQPERNCKKKQIVGTEPRSQYKDQRQSETSSLDEDHLEMPQLAKLYYPLSYLVSVYETLSLLNFLTFLVYGEYRSVEERVLGLQVRPIMTEVRRQLDFTYMRHHLYWHTVTEFLLAVVPSLDVDGFIGLLRAVLRWGRKLSRRRWNHIIKRVDSIEMKTSLPSKNPILTDISSVHSKDSSSVHPKESLKSRMMSYVIRWIAVVRRWPSVVHSHIADPTALNLMNNDTTSEIGSLTDLWRKRKRQSVKRLISSLNKSRINQNDITPDLTPSSDDSESDDCQGERLKRWLKDPLSFPCGLCGTSPIAVPFICVCECLTPVCYLCIKVKQDSGPVLCLYCGVLINEVRRLGAGDVISNDN